jgi:hypothetical protein
MADTKISALPASTTPLAGTEVLPIVQSGVTRQVSVANLTAGRAVSAASVTASTGNFVVGTSGQGIDFSATSGTGTSELLNDYEEGDWTLGISGMTLTGGTTIAKYTKVGRQVTVQVEMSDVTLSGTPSGTITGLPFANGTGRSSTSGVSYRFAFNNLSNNVVGIVLSGGTNIAFVSMNSALSWTDANFVATSITINFTATYFV